MKRILSFLLCIVFLKAQIFAISGGPESFELSNVDVTGTYSGTMIPSDDTDSINSDNTLGIFTLSMTTTGLGVGSFLVFLDGVVFSGDMTAVGDTEDGAVRAIIDGTFEFDDVVRDPLGNPLVTDGTVIPITVVNPIFGTMNAEVRNSSFSSISAISFGRISGDANMSFINQDGESIFLDLEVDGIKQSPFAAAADTDTPTTVP